MCRVEFAVPTMLVGFCLVSVGQQPANPAASDSQDPQREAAIAEFTRKMKEANYPPLFEKAAQEFNVPADLLKGIAFAETRWEHLTWPPGETASPDTGMPRPFGIMSLWDNPFFGHSLLEAAQLIGEDPEILKKDAFQNMRGAAALLRKLYDATAKPADTMEKDIESWRYAIRKYCGIPEPKLNAQHALDIYTFMSQGYHQYGIEWNARAVNLEPIRQETMRIVAEAEAKHQTHGLSMETDFPGTNSGDVKTARSEREALGSNSTMASSPSASRGAAHQTPEHPPPKQAVWWLIGGGPVIVSIALLLALKRRKNRG